jgi:hypothetical protein
MPKDGTETVNDQVLRYDRMVEDALRGVMRQCLALVARRGGLPGGHHFYITFRTRHAGVAIPSHLLARYPEEITIVLQHQFWNLDVGEDRFSVVLAFGGVRETLVVPFAAVSAFADPSAKFGLQYQVEAGEATAAPPQPTPAPAPLAEPSRPVDPPKGQVIALDAFRKK